MRSPNLNSTFSSYFGFHNRVNYFILGGTTVFVGTRVPIKTLLDYLEAGDSLNEFLDHFPSVSREQAIATLELAKEMLIAYATPA